MTTRTEYSIQTFVAVDCTTACCSGPPHRDHQWDCRPRLPQCFPDWGHGPPWPAVCNPTMRFDCVQNAVSGHSNANNTAVVSREINHGHRRECFLASASVASRCVDISGTNVPGHGHLFRWLDFPQCLEWGSPRIWVEREVGGCPFPDDCQWHADKGSVNGWTTNDEHWATK